MPRAVGGTDFHGTLQACAGCAPIAAGVDADLRHLTTILLVVLLFSASCARRRPMSGPMIPNSGSATGDALLSRFFSSASANVLRGVTMIARFDGRLPGMNKSAEIVAQRAISPAGAISYAVISQEGDATVRKELIARFMNEEISNALKDNSATSLNPYNYRFRYRGPRTQAGREIHVFEVNPREKDVGLFRGEVWLDGETGLPLHQEGRFVKSPSVWLKELEFSRDFEVRKGFSVPTVIRTSTRVRIYGLAELDIRFSDIVWDAPSSTGQQPAPPNSSSR